MLQIHQTCTPDTLAYAIWFYWPPLYSLDTVLMYCMDGQWHVWWLLSNSFVTIHLPATDLYAFHTFPTPNTNAVVPVVKEVACALRQFQHHHHHHHHQQQQQHHHTIPDKRRWRVFAPFFFQFFSVPLWTHTNTQWALCKFGQWERVREREREREREQSTTISKNNWYRKLVLWNG